MESKKIQFNFRAGSISIFDAIVDGSKKVETRANSPKFNKLKVGDIVVLSCAKQKEEKKIKKIEVFKSIKDLLKTYKVSDINPDFSTQSELEKMYYSFPNYKEKIEKFGLVSMEFE